MKISKKQRMQFTSDYLFQYGRSQGVLREAVIHVQKYLNVINDAFTQKRKVLTASDSFKNKIKKLNIYFKTFKITFKVKEEFSKNFSKNYGIVHGLCRGEDITIFVNNYFEDSLENEETYKQMIKQLLPLIGHELVHRGQWYISKSDFLNFYAFEKDDFVRKMDLENTQEIMAYALMAIENFRYSGYNDSMILEAIKSGKYQRNLSFSMTLYLDTIKEKNFNVYKRFVKYVYDYLMNPIKYDLKVDI